jgi:hypothetical protein
MSGPEPRPNTNIVEIGIITIACKKCKRKTGNLIARKNITPAIANALTQLQVYAICDSCLPMQVHFEFQN